MALFAMKVLLFLALTTTTATAKVSWQNQVPIKQGHHGNNQVPSQNILDATSKATFTLDGTYQVFHSRYSAEHSLRIKKQNDTVCDARTTQYTGWLDVGAKHLFFWYFESATAPEEDPLVLWLTGGPGGSSMLGMMEELGPCLIDGENSTKYNEYGWNQHANIIFVDQPAGVGFSYYDEGEPVVSNSFSAAEDMHRFLEIFTSQAFPTLLNRPFHISGESYGGHYVPILGARIVSQNILYPSRTQVNLQSILVGNGYFSPRDTAFGYWETLCTTKPGVKEPVFNSTRCDIMATNLPRCMELIDVCYENPDPAICLAAEAVCWEGVIKHYDGESYKGGRNRFDITAPCEMDEFCYQDIGQIEKYLNQKYIWEALDVPNSLENYTVASDEVAMAFQVAGDVGISTQPQVLYLLSSGIDVLVYQGMLDLACNTAGNLRWTNNMPWSGQAQFASEDLESWSLAGEEAGQYKEVYIQMPGVEAKTRFTFLTVAGAGHMVPMDKPAQALEMMTKWIQGQKFS